MGRVDLSEITPVAQDYLKVIWSATEWGDPPITSKALAQRMRTTAPNVTETLRRLAAHGLVEYQPYRPVVLTPLGRGYAIAMVRRHRLLETFLVTTMGYRWEEVHDEAERLEHAASDTLIERIDDQLGHPAVDPHGDPIPDAAGTLRPPAGATRLADAPRGEYTVVRVSDADAELLVRLGNHGVVPGATISVQDPAGHQREIQLSDRHLELAVRLADEDMQAVWVATRTQPAARGPKSTVAEDSCWSQHRSKP
jgi:DtxR family Mn-dependent transcriptional regulator